MNSKRIIYLLIDPRTGECRYVGKSERGVRRAREHMQPAFLQRPQHCACWLRSLSAEGLRPEIEVVESGVVDIDDAEMFWIGYFRSLGCRLTNHTNGGGGTSGYRKTVSAETRQKMSDAHKGKKFSAEHLANLSIAIKKRFTPEYVERTLKRRKGERRSEAARANYSRAQRIRHAKARGDFELAERIRSGAV